MTVRFCDLFSSKPIVESTGMLSKNSDGDVPPCIRCDKDTLKILNSHAAATRCVGVRFRMSRYCPRCEFDCFQDKLAYWTSKICDEGVTVNVGVPIGIYGSVERAVQSSRIASKGSEYRAHGSFVSQIQLLKCPEVLKISFQRWLPYVMNLAMSGKAHLEMPSESVDIVTSGYLDYKTTNTFECKYDRRVVSVIKRIRKLRADEELTKEATIILRKRDREIRNDLLNRMKEFESDDVFKLGLVVIKEKSDLSVVPEAQLEDYIAHTEDICQAYDGRISQIKEETERKIENMNWELDRLNAMVRESISIQREVEGRREAEVSPDAGVRHHRDEPSVGVYPRDALLSARIISDDGNVGFAAMTRRDRRSYRVSRRMN